MGLEIVLDRLDLSLRVGGQPVSRRVAGAHEVAEAANVGAHITDPFGRSNLSDHGLWRIDANNLVRGQLDSYDSASNRVRGLDYARLA
jgi:hypothetical protein